MFDVEVVLGQAFNPPSDLTHWLFEGPKPLHSAVVGAYFGLFTKDVAAKVTQLVD